jgi:hypothetical protein
MGLLARIRVFVLAFALLATVPVFIAIATAPRLPLSREVAAAAVVVLGALWVRAFRKQALQWPLELLTGACLAVLLSGLSEVSAVHGFFFAPLMFNGLFGGPLQLLLRLALVEGAYFSRGTFSPLLGTAFTAVGVLFWAVGRATAQQEQRERPL